MSRDHSNAAPTRLLLAAGVFGLALGGLIPGLSPGSAAWAQDASVTTPTDLYFRIELGAAQPSAGDANWLPPGPDDPRVFFDLDLDSSAMGGLAIGGSFGEGWRGEVAVNVFDSSDFSGNWSYTEPADPGPHASMEGTVRSVAFFANGYYDVPVEGDFTPFVTAGLGYARNTMSDWTRINPDSDRATRTFGSASDSGFAWNVGAGVAWDVDSVMGSGPVKLEVAWRYFDLGSINGSDIPLDDNGSSSPREPLNFDLTNQVFSVGLRFPL